MIFLYALTMNALTLSMIENFVHAFAVVCKLLTLKLNIPFMFFHTLKDCHVFILLWCYSHKKNAERSQGKKHQSFTLMITLFVQSDLGPNCMPTPFSVEQNCLCNSGRGHHEEHFCEII